MRLDTERRMVRSSAIVVHVHCKKVQNATQRIGSPTHGGDLILLSLPFPV